jgi:ATP:ADP antiporter, AAA family
MSTTVLHRFVRSLRLLPADGAQRALVLRMAALNLLLMCALGILKPIKNAFALVGLGDVGFYRVYFVSAAVLLLVPVYSRLARHVAAHRLALHTALFFIANLMLLRAVYRDGSLVFGVGFYGWYDLVAAVLVTQFFLTAQRHFDPRLAREAYPVVIAGGAIGATLGGVVTGLLAARIAPPNLMFAAAAALAAFALALPTRAAPAASTEPRGGEGPEASGVGVIFADPHVRLIALAVLLSGVVKQLVDYQFNTLTGEVFLTSEAISAFQGKFLAATQWLPLVVLAVLHPLLRRRGVAAVLFLLPAVLLLANVGIAAAWSLAMAAGAKAADIGLRHTAERTGREILYLPVPERIKQQAKLYIDVGIEEGVAKVLSALLIGGTIALAGHTRTGWLAALLCVAWLAVAVAIRQEYVSSLARSIRGRVASFRGVMPLPADASTLPVLRRALTSDDASQPAFMVDMLDEADDGVLRDVAGELHALLAHPVPALRRRAIELLARVPDAMDAARVGACAGDEDEGVCEAAIRALCAARPAAAAAVLDGMIESPEPAARRATIACLADGVVPRADARRIAGRHLDACLADAQRGDRDARLEVALCLGVLGDDARGPALLEPLLRDADAAVAAAALRSTGQLRVPVLYPRIIEGLRTARTRGAAREALIHNGSAVLGPLTAHLLDERGDPWIRRQIPSVYVGIATQAAVDALVHAVEAPETDDLLDYRALKVLSQLRVRHPALSFRASATAASVEREIQAAEACLRALALLRARGRPSPVFGLLGRALEEAVAARRERVFRWLGLMHVPGEMHRCYLSLTRGGAAARANALEWLEQTVGPATFRRIEPLVAASQTVPAAADLLATLDALARGGDPWIAQCARAARSELACGDGTDEDGRGMNPIEKVLLLQQVDLLSGASSMHLSLLASIAEEVEVAPGDVLQRAGLPTESLHVVVRGAVELTGLGDQRLLARDGTPFGTWALIDDSPSPVDARAVEPTLLLRVSRSDFHDLLADHHELTLGLLQGLARRVRLLAS